MLRPGISSSWYKECLSWDRVCKKSYWTSKQKATKTKYLAMHVVSENNMQPSKYWFFSLSIALCVHACGRGCECARVIFQLLYISDLYTGSNFNMKKKKPIFPTLYSRNYVLGGNPIGQRVKNKIIMFCFNVWRVNFFSTPSTMHDDDV